MFADEKPEGHPDQNDDAADRRARPWMEFGVVIPPERVEEIQAETATRRDFASIGHALTAVRKEAALIAADKVTASKTKRLALARHLTIIIPRWRDLIALRETALALADDPSAPFAERLYTEIRSAFWQMVMTYDAAVSQEQWGRLGGVATQAERLHKAATELARHVDAAVQRYATQAPKPGNWREGLGAVEARLRCGLIQSTAVSLASSILNLTLAMKPPPEEPKAEKPYARNSANVLRMRKRRRAGVVAQVPVSLYREDAALLRTLGFLPPGEPTREQQTAAIEAFMMSSFLGRTDPGLTWDQREDSQAGRAKSLDAPEEED